MNKTYSVQFFNCLVEAIQKCCHDYLKFEQTVELGGFLFLEIDNYKKERYILSEMVHNTGDVTSESYCIKTFESVNRHAKKTSNLSSDIPVNQKSSGILTTQPETIDQSVECFVSLPNDSNPVSLSSRQWKPQQNENDHSEASRFDEHDSSINQASTSLSSSININSPLTAGRPGLRDIHVHVVNKESELGNPSSTYIIRPPLKAKPMRSLLKNFAVPSSQTCLSDNRNNKTSSASFDQRDFSNLKNTPERQSSRLKFPGASSPELCIKDEPDSDVDSVSSLVPDCDAKMKSLHSETDSKATMSSAEIYPCSLTSNTELSEPSTKDSIRLPLPEMIDIKEEYDLNNVVILVDSHGNHSNISQTVKPNITPALRSKRKQLKVTTLTERVMPASEEEKYQEQQSKSSKKGYRYKPDSDVILLKEVLALNPFENTDQWIQITHNFNDALLALYPSTQAVNTRSVRERFDKLLKTFNNQEMESLRNSGCAKDYCYERERLLGEIVSLKEEIKHAKKNKDRKKDEAVNECQVIRKRSMEMCSGDNDEIKSDLNSKKMKMQSNTELEDYTVIKSQELEIRRQELALRCEELEMEKEQRRLRMEKESAVIDLLKTVMETVRK